jgi:hypothetical protein
VIVAVVITLKEAFNSLHTALWKQCTETKDCLLIHGLLYLLTFRNFSRKMKINNDINFCMLFCYNFK